MNTAEIAKQAAALAAVELIQDGMLVGLGTGSTAAFFIDGLIERCKRGLKITAVATSAKSHDQALKGGIALADINQLTSIDMAVDGADEIDPVKRMIKGGGGALLREKIIASMSREMVVIVDEKKLVSRLGKFPLPVEIVTFGWKATLAKIERAGFYGSIRLDKPGVPFITDNGNYIYDIAFPHLIADPEKTHQDLKALPGVVETGLFLNLAGRVVIGFEDGRIEVKE